MRVALHDNHPRVISRLLQLIAASLAALALTACATRGGDVAYNVAGFDRPDVEAIPATEGLQRVAPMDKLSINVFQVESLSGEFEVDSAGAISFPLIGTVEAQGKTTPELAQLIAGRLSQRYLQSPSVQVSIKESAGQTITVDGSVRQPGVYPTKGPTTLMKAVAMARGTSEDANASRVLVFRTLNGKRMAAAFDLAAIRRAQAEDPAIYGNDLVVVDGSKTRALYRDIMSSIPLLGIFTLL